MTETHNGMTAIEQSEIPLHVFTLSVRIETSAEVVMDEAMLEAINGAIWCVLPRAEDGDVFVEVVE